MYFLILIFMRLVFINIIDDAAAMHNGNSVEEDDIKFIAYITLLIDNEYYSCTGGVIDEFHIITAAHCVACPKLLQLNVFVGSAAEIVSKINLYRPAKVYVHPNYTAAERSSICFSCLDFLKHFFFSRKSPKQKWTPTNDIAIVKVKRRMKLGKDFTNVKLPISKSLPYCRLLHFAGWDTPISTWSATLQSTEIILIQDENCNVQHSNEHFCANTIDGAGRLGPGDSGSPLIHNNILYGIILGGADTAGLPFVFTKIFHHIDFITEVLEKGKVGEAEEKREKLILSDKKSRNYA